MWDNVAGSVLVENSNHVFDIEALAVVIEQFLDIAVIELLPIELLSTVLVNNMPVAALLKPSKSIYSTSLLVDVEALLRLEELRNGATSALIILEFKITHQVMWVEIELLNAEGSWNLALFINVCGVEKLLFSMVLENVTCVRILQITTHICRMTCLVYILSTSIL